MFCTVELMLTGLCINIPMLQSFYLLYRAEYKNSQLSGTPSQESSSRPREGQQVPPLQPNRGDYSAWIELGPAKVKSAPKAKARPKAKALSPVEKDDDDDDDDDDENEEDEDDVEDAAGTG
ncbi:hypothetical protein ACO1O0_004658 [Amphichorda felina]